MTVITRLALVALVGSLALAACGGSDEPVSLDGAWARASAPTQTNGAVYFELSSNVADVLTGATVDATVAADAQVHEVVPANDASTDASMDHDEMPDGEMSDDSETATAMTMQELTAGLPVADGETVRFEPGGYHVMLVDLAAPLVVGDEIELTLEFAAADDLTVSVPVREAAP